MAVDHAFLRTPQDFSNLLIEIQEGSWPPDEADVLRIRTVETPHPQATPMTLF